MYLDFWNFFNFAKPLRKANFSFSQTLAINTSCCVSMGLFLLCVIHLFLCNFSTLFSLKTEPLMLHLGSTRMFYCIYTSISSSSVFYQTGFV